MTTLIVALLIIVGAFLLGWFLLWQPGDEIDGPGAVAGPVRPSWDDYFLGIAEAVSMRADCTRRKVGAVLVDTEHRILSTGYNGAPAGEPGCLTAGACPRGRVGRDVVQTRTSYTEGAGRCIAVHAEVNAINYGMRWLPDWSTLTLYVTCEPCPQCYQACRDVGITRILWAPGSD